MRYIRDILSEARAQGRVVISFEFFTPKTPEGEVSLNERTIPLLKSLKPDFCSVTYGAGGSTRGKTLDLVDVIQRRHGIVSMAHLTCVNATRQETIDIINEAKNRGIKNILALRGDPPGGVGEFKKIDGGFEFAYQLVELIKQIGGFSIGVAGFPEGHIACKEGKYVDWDRLKAKIEKGADFVITQFFFDNVYYFEMRDYLLKKGVNIPIIPGIIPITSAAQIKKFTALCGATIPKTMEDKLAQLGDDDDATTEYGIDFATKQCEELLKNGVPALHFYTLNKSIPTMRIIKNLGLR
ncbi:MAG: methylenetetrahydrofolate reductase [NAD(P)H] [Verrucomicrobiia bacterium]